MKRSELLRNDNISCNATRCIHNKSTECMAGVINIRGVEAVSTKQTTCTTFVDEGGYGYDHLSNLYDNDKSITKTKDIQCAAENCKYNTKRECHANKVTINAANASCQTFECD